MAERLEVLSCNTYVNALLVCDVGPPKDAPMDAPKDVPKDAEPKGESVHTEGPIQVKCSL